MILQLALPSCYIRQQGRAASFGHFPPLLEVEKPQGGYRFEARRLGRGEFIHRRYKRQLHACLSSVFDIVRIFTFFLHDTDGDVII